MSLHELTLFVGGRLLDTLASSVGGEGSKVSGPYLVTLDGSSCRGGDSKFAILTVQLSALAPSLADDMFL
jgi:hypothetical protein